jgi:hypothetical protein
MEGGDDKENEPEARHDDWTDAGLFMTVKRAGVLPDIQFGRVAAACRLMAIPTVVTGFAWAFYDQRIGMGLHDNLLGWRWRYLADNSRRRVI